MKNIVITTIASCLLAGAAFAADDLGGKPPKPAACPAASSVATAGLATVVDDTEDNFYVAIQENQYGTKQTWGFMILVPHGSATDTNDAMTKATNALGSLALKTTKMSYADGQYECDYKDSEGYLAAALTPVDTLKASIHKAALAR